VPLTPAQQAVANAAANGGGSFVNSFVQNEELVVVVVTVNSGGGVTDFSYFNASTGQPSSINIGASLNPNAGANENLGSFLAANPTIAGTTWVNPYTPPPSN
jgi:transcription initiation factor TFIID subunit TAF12